MRQKTLYHRITKCHMPIFPERFVCQSKDYRMISHQRETNLEAIENAGT